MVRTRRGARVMYGKYVLSEVLARPGPTHSVFDVMAALISVAKPYADAIAMLGFAGGGIVAPLRALGVRGRVSAVDLSVEAVPWFRRLSRSWSGAVDVTKGDAVPWVSRRRGRFDVVIDDLSEQIDGDIFKPSVSLERLPQPMAAALRPGGLVVINAIPSPSYLWEESLWFHLQPHRDARAVRLFDFENHILLAGERLPTAPRLGRLLRQALRRLGSKLATRVSVHTVRRA